MWLSRSASRRRSSWRRLQSFESLHGAGVENAVSCSYKKVALQEVHSWIFDFWSEKREARAVNNLFQSVPDSDMCQAEDRRCMILLLDCASSILSLPHIYVPLAQVMR